MPSLGESGGTPPRNFFQITSEITSQAILGPKLERIYLWLITIETLLLNMQKHKIIIICMQTLKTRSAIGGPYLSLLEAGITQV